MQVEAPTWGTEGTQRLCDLGLGFVLILFVWRVWPSLTLKPLGLDDQGLVAEFAQVGVSRVWGFDHFGHLRPIKNLCFWGLSQRPELLGMLRGLGIFCACGCAWLLRSLSLALGLTPLTAAVAAALWLMNPTTAVGVVWLSAGNYLFAALGVLIYLLLMERAGARRSVALAFAHVALLFAALSHELAMLAPIWVVLRWWLDGTLVRRDVAPVLVGAGLVLLVPAGLRLSHDAPELLYRSELPMLQLMASAAFNFVQNLGLWVWLSSRFGVLLTQTAAHSSLVAIVAWVGALGAFGLLWRVSKSFSLRLALVWVLLFLLPVVNLIPLGVTPVAMHYLILPGVGLAWLVALALAWIERRSQRRGTTVSILLAAAIMLGWQPAFRRTVHAFSDEVALYRASLANYPDNLEVRLNLIAAYGQAGKLIQAQRLLEESLVLAPSDPGLLKHQLTLLTQGGHKEQALAWFDQHVELVRSDADLTLRRALLLAKLGRNAEAEALFKDVLSSTKNRDIRAHAGYQLANLRVQAGRLQEAQALLLDLHTEQPQNADIKLALNLLNEVLRPPSTR